MSGGLASLPVRTTRLADTTGTPVRRAYSTVNPFGNVKLVGDGSFSVEAGPAAGLVLRHGSSALTLSPLSLPPVGGAAFGTSGASFFSPGTPNTTTRALVVRYFSANAFTVAGVVAR